MPAANVAILYWATSTIMWGKVVADTDAEIQHVQDFYAKEANTSVLLIPSGQDYSDVACRTAIAKATGISTPSDRCAMVDANNLVVNVIAADPAMNTIPNATLVQSDTALVGATHNAQTKTFINPIVVSTRQSKTLPA